MVCNSYISLDTDSWIYHFLSSGKIYMQKLVWIRDAAFGHQTLDGIDRFKGFGEQLPGRFCPQPILDFCKRLAQTRQRHAAVSGAGGGCQLQPVDQGDLKSGLP